MPRKAKIVAVPVDEPVAEPGDETTTEVKTDAEEMTTVINELKTDDQQCTAKFQPVDTQ